MADTYQVKLSNTNGDYVEFKTDNLRITYLRPFLFETVRSDGAIIVTDEGVGQRVFKFTAEITGDEANKIDGWLMAAITYSGAYPEINVINWDGDSTESNIEVYIPSGGCVLTDLGAGNWHADITLREKTR